MQTFSDIMKNFFLEKYEISEASKAYETFEMDCGVTKRTFIAYFTGQYVPTYESARKILNAMKLDVSEENLSECLKMSKKIRPIGDKTYKKFVTLHYENFGLDSADSLDDVIQQRMEEEGIDSFSQYVSELIKNDLGL